MKQKVTSEFLKTHGFTNIETIDVDRQLGYEFWTLGTENIITNSDLHITLRNDDSFRVRYIDNVAHNLHTINELKAALRLFKCLHLVNLDEESPKYLRKRKFIGITVTRSSTFRIGLMYSRMEGFQGKKQ